MTGRSDDSAVAEMGSVLPGGPRPQVAVIEITNRCNLECVHCGSSSGPARAAELSTDELRRLIDDLAALGCEHVTLLGGEIFLRPDWHIVADHVRRLGLKLVLITNGLLLDGPRLERLVELCPYVVGVSIDGATPEGYERVRGGKGFHAACSALERLVGAGLTGVNAITTFHRLNLPEFDAFIPLFRNTIVNWQVQIAGKGGRRFAPDLFFRVEDYLEFASCVQRADKIPGLRLTTMDDFGYYPLDEGLSRLRDWHGCFAGILVVAIRSNGDVLPCLSLGDDFVVSNIRRQSLAETWRSDTAFAPFRRKLERLTGECAACSVRHRCRGGCSAIAYSATGSIFEDPYCLRAIDSRSIVDAICATGSGRGSIKSAVR